jgi:hypothetical protein
MPGFICKLCLRGNKGRFPLFLCKADERGCVNFVF